MEFLFELVCEVFGELLFAGFMTMTGGTAIILTEQNEKRKKLSVKTRLVIFTFVCLIPVLISALFMIKCILKGGIVWGIVLFALFLAFFLGFYITTIVRAALIVKKAGKNKGKGLPNHEYTVYNGGVKY